MPILLFGPEFEGLLRLQRILKAVEVFEQDRGTGRRLSVESSLFLGGGLCRCDYRRMYDIL